MDIDHGIYHLSGRYSCCCNGRISKGGGIYVASQVTWYPGLALLGPEIIQKSKDIWNNLKQRIKDF